MYHLRPPFMLHTVSNKINSQAQARRNYSLLVPIIVMVMKTRTGEI